MTERAIVPPREGWKRRPRETWTVRGARLVANASRREAAPPFGGDGRRAARRLTRS